MRISQKTEWALVAVLIGYIAFTPGFAAVRDFLSTGVGKAVGLAVIVAAWKYLSPLVALLLLVNFVRCASMREYADDASMKPSPCPENSELKDGQCRNKTTGQSTPVSPSPSPSAAVPPAAMPPPPSTSSTQMKPPSTAPTSPPMAEGFQPNMKEKGNYAPV